MTLTECLDRKMFECLTIRNTRNIWSNIYRNKHLSIHIELKLWMKHIFCHHAPKTAIVHHYKCISRSVCRNVRQTLCMWSKRHICIYVCDEYAVVCFQGILGRLLVKAVLWLVNSANSLPPTFFLLNINTSLDHGL